MYSHEYIIDSSLCVCSPCLRAHMSEPSVASAPGVSVLSAQSKVWVIDTFGL